jgi:hypothetical protein
MCTKARFVNFKSQLEHSAHCDITSHDPQQPTVHGLAAVGITEAQQ